MSILIKGIDIPKCCDQCALKYSIKCKTYTGYHHQDTSRANKCPIIEVSTEYETESEYKESEDENENR